jgi:hypothetical protein
VTDPGDSPTRSGENIIDAEGKEEGREAEGTKGQSERPVGSSDPRDSTGVNPQETVTGGPTQPAGDQGG